MKHQRFEEWLYSEARLSTAQEQALAEHLETCVSCQERAAAMEEINTLLGQTEMAAPAAGFVMRWEQKLEADLQRRRNMRRWLSMIVGLVIAAAVFTAPGLPPFLSLSSLISGLLIGMAKVSTFFEALRTVLESFAGLFPQIPLAIWWSAASVSLGLLAATWLLALNQFVYKQGV